TSIFAALFLLLVVMLFRLQVYHQQQYLRHSEKNRIRRLILPPDRGLIYDRQQVVLVDNSPAYSLYATPFECLQNDTILVKLSEILGTGTDSLAAELRRADSPFTAVRLRRNLDYSALVQIEEWKLALPGVFYEVEPMRIYPSPVQASHLFGYLGEVARAELKSDKYAGLRAGDMIGKTGLEKTYDRRLRGQIGYDYIEVDAFGHEVRNIEMEGEVDKVRGEDLFLSLDERLQELAEELFAEKKGGLVLIDTRNGEILALCSKPDYNPNLFSGGIKMAEWRRLITDETHPLYDRMVKSTYAPGSTYKIVLAAAALENGIIRPNSKVHCPGYFVYGMRSFGCWKEGGHGTLDLGGAIRESCNTYFYTLSTRVDVDQWADFSRRFGFGQATGIDVPGEAAGLTPDREYLDKTYRKGGWTRGMMLNLGIGQGDLLTTPLQMAQFAMILGNRGVYYQPHLLRAVYQPGRGDTLWIAPVRKNVVGMSPQNLEFLAAAMCEVVNEAGGTGMAASVPGVLVAGKTGTAQNPHGDTHAWFIGFAPFESAQVAICVFVENGGSGGGVAAPLAGTMLKRYFQLYPADAAREKR
ncbi:MAG TPA: penicillin-binding protein 2, partial [bacterium]|nr:penicillin-binding protein 2 [bacterium]HNT65101.1 penicillin-binding protein 2 [bacterium]